MPRVVVQQPERDLVERGLDSGDLREHVHARPVLLDHPLDTADLSLHAPQALAQLVLRGGVAARRRGHGVGGGHAFDGTPWGYWPYTRDSASATHTGLSPPSIS